MRRIKAAACAALMCGLAWMAGGEEPPSAEQPEATHGPLALPQLPSGQMVISWDDFRSLLERMQSREEAEEEETPRPPQPYVLSDAQYIAEAVDAISVRIEATLHMDHLEPTGWSAVPVAGAGVAPTAVRLNGEPAALAEKGDRLVLLLDEPGAYTLEITFFVPLETQEGTATLAFAVPRTPQTAMTLRLPLAEAALEAPAAAHIAMQTAANGMTAELAFRPTEEIRVAWTRPAAEEAVPEEDPRVACTASTLATLGEHHGAAQTLMRLDVLRGSIDAVRMRLPNEVNVLGVDGTGIAWTTQPLDETGQQHIEVKGNHRWDESFVLALRYEFPIPEEAAAVSMPVLTVDDMTRQAGYTALTAGDTLQISESAATDGATRIDVSELPPPLLALAARPVLLAYRHSGPDYLLAAEVRRLGAVEVSDAAIEFASLTTVITPEGAVATRARYLVRNSVKQFLRLELGEQATVRSTKVGGQAVKPAREEDTGALLIPLLRSAANSRTNGAFPVEVNYLAGTADLPESRTQLALKAPAPDILANRVEWAVYLPTQYDVIDSAGGLNPMSGLDVGSDNGPMVRTAGPGENEDIFRLREGIERFFITDINNPASASRFAGPDRYTGEERKPLEAPPSESGVAGILPVAVGLPITGTPHWFERVLPPEGEALELVLDLKAAAPESGQTPWIAGTIIGAAALLVALGIALRAKRARKTGETS